MDFEIPSGECQETTGFLFAHRCGNLALNKCYQCQKTICADHTVFENEMMYCTSCGQQRLAAQDQSTPNVDSRSNYSQNPFFYHYYYFPSYHHHSSSHHDRSDFTDADQAAFQSGDPSREDLAGFEQDMTGS